MDWMRKQDVKEEPQEASGALTPEDDDECYFEEDAIDEGMVRYAVLFPRERVTQFRRAVCEMCRFLFLK